MREHDLRLCSHRLVWRVGHLQFYSAGYATRSLSIYIPDPRCITRGDLSSTFILISQNHDTLLAERRNQFDLQINMLAEQENTKMLELLGKIAEKVGVD